MAASSARISRPPRADDIAPYSPTAEHLAAAQRMAREPNLLAAFEPGTWVAFNGEAIVASGADYEAVVRAAKEAGALDPILVPVIGDPFVGGST